MFTPNLQIPWWWIVLFLAAFGGTTILCAVGIYYFISNKFDKTAFIISVVIAISLVIFISSITHSETINSILVVLGLPFSSLGVLFPLEGFPLFLSSLIAIAINYIALFSIVNFLHRLLAELNF
jgi:hypothetical protein